MRVSSQIIDELVAHAREDDPNECCGMIGGRDGRLTSVYRARNKEASPLRYVIDSRDQLRITQEIEARGEEIAAIYHSHTRSPAEPSQTDVNLAEGWPDPLYVIVSIAESRQPSVRGWSIREGVVEEVQLDVE